MPLILGIETSCDETSLALVGINDGARALRAGNANINLGAITVCKNLVSSQIKIHAPFGGVVPNLAKREHKKNLPILYRQIFGGARKTRRGAKPNDLRPTIHGLDIIAVTVGPGLEPALWTGIEFAKALKSKLAVGKPNKRPSKKPAIVGANHLEGHLYSFLLPRRNKTANPTEIRNQKSIFPAISLIASGGHTILLLMKNLISWKRLGETRDDAAGEAFDKVARIMGFPYPGGPEIEKAARSGNPKAVTFPRPMLNQKNYDFSFSGLKTAVLYYLRDLSGTDSGNLARIATAQIGKNTRGPRAPANLRQLKSDVAASFQAAAIDVLVQKTMRAAREFGVRSVMLSGGVAANMALQNAMRREAKKIGARFFAPATPYNTDNAAMIAVAGYFAHLRRKHYELEAQGMLNI